MFTEKKSRGKRWKSYCNSICTSCNSIFYVKKAKRYCYEDKYDLPKNTGQIIYKKNKKVNTIATGIIDHKTTKFNKNKIDSEKNYHTIKFYNNDRYIYLFKELCLCFDIEYKLFIKKFKKLKKELIDNEI